MHMRRECPTPSWLILADGREIMRLDYLALGPEVGWYRCRVTFSGISEEEWCRFYAGDPRDVPWILRRIGTDESIPFARFEIAWHGAHEISLRLTQRYDGRRAGWCAAIMRLFGIAHGWVTTERSPHNPWVVGKRRIRKMLKSGEETEIFGALVAVPRHGSRLQWADDLLYAYAAHESSMVRFAAVSGFGELGRLHGYVN